LIERLFLGDGSEKVKTVSETHPEAFLIELWKDDIHEKRFVDWSFDKRLVGRKKGKDSISKQIFSV
jgi:hypothetical protein